MGQLDHLFLLNLQGLNKLSLDPSLLNGPTKGITAFLKSRRVKVRVCTEVVVSLASKLVDIPLHVHVHKTTHACTHDMYMYMYIYIYTHTHAHTHIHAHAHAHTHMHMRAHTHAHTHAHTNTHTHTHTECTVLPDEDDGGGWPRER